MSYFDEIMDAWTDAGNTTVINRVCVEYFKTGTAEVHVGYETEEDGIVSEISLEVCDDFEEADSVMSWFAAMMPTCRQYQHYRNGEAITLLSSSHSGLSLSDAKDILADYTNNHFK